MFWDVHTINLFVQELRNYKIMYFLNIFIYIYIYVVNSIY